MASQDISLKLEERSTVRKGLSSLRNGGLVPAVIHNHGAVSILVQSEYIPLNKVYSQAGKHHPVELQVDGKKHLALIKQVDMEPTKRRIRHVVFQAIRSDEKTEAKIPVILEGEEIPAQKKGLLILTQLDMVEVEALPKDLPNQFTVDATVLAEVGDRLHVSDIKVPSGVTILTEPEQTLAVVEMPKDQVAEADAAAAALAEDAGAAAEAAAEPEPTEETSEEKAEETPETQES